MLPAAALLAFAIPVVASPVKIPSSPLTLSFARHISSSSGSVNLGQQEQASSAALLKRAAAIQSGQLDHRDIFSPNFSTYKPFSSWVTTVGVGAPPTNYDLIIQLNTANIWIGADKPYKETKSSKDTGQPVGLYASTVYWNGEEWLDDVDLGAGLVVYNQSIGVANSSHGLDAGIDGVLGLAPSFMTLGTLWNQLDEMWPNVVQSLYNQGSIPEDLFAISSSPSTSPNMTGELSFGFTDPSKYTGEINYVPISEIPPSVLFWGIDQSISYGDKMIMSKNAGVVDPTHTLIVLASDVYSAYMNATGAVEDAATGLPRLTRPQYDKLQDLNFHIGSVTYALTPNGQIWPRALNSYIGGRSDAIYCIFARLNVPAGASGFNFVLGQAWVERFYTVIDHTRERIGFATTSYTNSTVN